MSDLYRAAGEPVPIAGPTGSEKGEDWVGRSARKAITTREIAQSLALLSH